MNKDVRQKFDQFVYPAPLVAVVLYQWISTGLSFIVQGALAGDKRMATGPWYYIRSLDFLPGGASLWWGIIWIVAGLLVAVSLFLGIKQLTTALCIASAVPFSWLVLFFLAAIRDSSASFSGCVTYLTLTFLAVVTGVGLKGKVGISDDWKV